MTNSTGLFVFTIGVLCFFLYNFHYLIILISLEVISLSLIISSVWFILQGHLFVFFVVLVTVVCMAGYGVSLLICYVRPTGSSFFLF